MKYLIAALLISAVSGCQTAYQKAQSPRSVVFYGVTDLSVADATEKAQRHCETYGRDAELQPESFKDGVAVFRCTDRST